MELYNEKIERLISLALVDGVLTEKEKQILLKKAEAEGLDLDEFEMVLDAKLHILKTEQQENEKAQNAMCDESDDVEEYEEESEEVVEVVAPAPKSDKLGDIKKCPACGSLMTSFSTNCEDCGFEIRNVELSANVMKFAEKLDAIEADNNENHYQDDPSLFDTIRGIALLPVKAVEIALLKSANLTNTEKRKKEFITNFPIPATKEDLIEFMSLFVSRIEPIQFSSMLSDSGKHTDYWNKVWMSKMSQIEYKSKLSMKNDKAGLAEIKELAAKGEKIHKSNKSIINWTLVIVILFSVLVIAGIIFAVCNYDINHTEIINNIKRLSLK